MAIVALYTTTGLAGNARRLMMPADTIFIRGHVVTVDSKRPEAEALAVAQGTIIAVGDEKTVMERRGPGTKIVDLGGRTLMPGFIDPHTHVVETAFNTHIMTNLSSFSFPMNPGTIEEVVKQLQAAVPSVPDQDAANGGWLLAFGVDPSRTTPFMDALDAIALDRVSKKVPIFVLNQSGHIAYVNHKAMERAGVKDNPTGVFYEPPTYAPFQAAVAASPSMRSAADDRRMLPALQDTYDSFARAGVTTATEMTLGLVLGSIEKELGLLQVMGKDPDTPVRIRAYIDYTTAERPKQLQIKRDPKTETDMFAVIGVKFVADGSTQGLSAALKKPYDYPTGTENTGILNDTVGDLYNGTKKYMDKGWQLSIHSNGDASTAQVLEVYSRLFGDKPHPEKRMRIEHLTVTEEPQLDTIQKLGLTPSMTNGHVYYWGYTFDQKKILGSARAQRIDPARSLRDKKVRFSFHSDSPITPVEPLRYISTAVTRRLQADPTKVLGSDQTIDVDDAIRAVTINAAYQLFLDDKIGSLEVGKWADLVILEKNPRTTKPEDIMKIGVVSTYLSGVCKSGCAKVPAPVTP